MSLSVQDLAALIDHTLLKPEADEPRIRRLCEEARQFRFHSVCVNPYWTSYCAKFLKDSDVRTCTVVGFPLGATTTSVKRYEAEEAISNAACEIDMVMAIGALKSGLMRAVEADIRSVVDAARRHDGVLVKVILEAPLLSDEEKLIACDISRDAGADFVKTCTGFGLGQATIHDVTLLQMRVGPTLGVKAAGGIRTCTEALAMIRAGATRLGTSRSVDIITEARRRGTELPRRESGGEQRTRDS